MKVWETPQASGIPTQSQATVSLIFELMTLLLWPQ
jgi:hypothetical protein